MGLLEKIFGTHSENELKRIYPIVDRIEALDEEMQKLTDEELRDKTREFKERLAKGETLDDLLPEAFATVREAASRTLHMKHYRVQLIGGIVLHQGRIAEMRTGEGKTLVSTLPAYLNALTTDNYPSQKLFLAQNPRIARFLTMSISTIRSYNLAQPSMLLSKKRNAIPKECNGKQKSKHNNRASAQKRNKP